MRSYQDDQAQSYASGRPGLYNACVVGRVVLPPLLGQRGLHIAPSPRCAGSAVARRIRRAGVAVTLVLLLMATALAGVAYAKIISGTPGNDYLLGTIKTDLIRGRGGDDYIRALAGDDLLFGGAVMT